MNDCTIMEATLRLSPEPPCAVLSIEGSIETLLGFSALTIQAGNVSILDRVHPEDRDIVDAWLACQPGSRPAICKLRMRHANGRIRCLQVEYFREPSAPDGSTALRLRLRDAKNLFSDPDGLTSNASLRAMMENTNDFIYFKDRNHVFTGASQTLTGITQPTMHWTDLIGQTDYDVFPEEYADIYYRLEKQIFAGQPVAQEIQEFQTNDGRKGWVDNRKYPIRNEQGEITGLFGIARDITDRIVADQALRQEHETLQMILDYAPLGIWLQDGNGQIAFVNKAFCQASGIPEAQFLSARHYADLIPEAFRAQCLASDAKALASDGVSTTHQRLPFVDGQIHDLLVIKAVKRDSQNKVTSLVGLSLDITEEIRQEQALRLERDSTRNILATVEAMIVALDLEGRITLVNRKGCQILGYREDELIGQDWFTTCLPSSIEVDQVREVFKMALAGDLSGSEYYENWVRTRSGEERLIAWHNSTIRDKEGRIIGGLSAGEDITERKKADIVLRESEQLLHAVIDEIPDPVLLKDRNGDFLLCNEAVARLYNTTPDAMVGKHDGDFGVPMEMAEAFRENVLSIMAKGETEIVYEDSMDGATGEIHHYKSIKKPFKNAQGQDQILIVAQEITDVVRAQAQVAASEQRLQEVLAITNEGVWDWHVPSGKVIHNPQWFSLFGAKPGEIDETIEAFSQHVHPEDLDDVMKRLSAMLDGNCDDYHSRHRLQRVDGRTIWVLDRGRVVERDEHGKPVRIIGSVSDVTYQVEHQHQLEHIAHYDALTNLPNRVLLADRLHQAMVQAQRRGDKLAVAYLDLDGFKAINDEYGHDAGDRLLSILANRMKSELRTADTLARLGGDEFVAVMTDLSDIENCMPLLTRLLSAASEVVQDQGHLLRVSASLGVTFFPQPDAIDADQLLRQADQAMYQAKLAGKNRYHIFDTELDRSMRGRHEGLEHIQRGLRKNEFVLHYQPKVNMRTGAVIGVEALIRWQHPERGMLPPAAFLPLITNHPLSIDLGEWVLETAMTQIEVWKLAGQPMPISVNIDALQLEQIDFVDRLRKQLTRHPLVSAGDLELEVLETSALEEMAHVSSVIMACRELGVSFALDDFGTGYSSLTYLKRLPAGLLKVDQSFVRDMLDDPDDLAILEGVLGLASAFRRQAIAEGVETLAHGRMLLQLGCELGQGYAIARPMPAENIPAWLKEWHPDPSWLNCNPVSREELPIMFASVEHRAWITQITHYLQDERNALPQLDDHLCRFGDWLHKDAVQLHANHPAIKAIEPLHAEIHARAMTLIRLKQQGRGDIALERLNELYSLRDNLLEQLMSMLE
jgi:diguanylate cyclase (GGDEF)-like protein/PAS domain S-box-containing protein